MAPEVPHARFDEDDPDAIVTLGGIEIRQSDLDRLNAAYAAHTDGQTEFTRADAERWVAEAEAELGVELVTMWRKALVNWLMGDVRFTNVFAKRSGKTACRRVHTLLIERMDKLAEASKDLPPPVMGSSPRAVPRPSTRATYGRHSH